MKATVHDVSNTESPMKCDYCSGDLTHVVMTVAEHEGVAVEIVDLLNIPCAHHSGSTWQPTDAAEFERVTT